MTISIYEKLREQLNQYSIGFPATQSGIEIKILKRLFTEEEAGMYLDMTMMLETPESIAAHTGRNVEAVSFILANMAKKGLLFRHRKGKEVKYGAVPFVIGSYEYQLKNMDLELAGMVEDYFQEGFLDFTPKKNMLPLRTIPVQQSIQVIWPVAPYVQSREIIKTKEKIALADCICRIQQEKIGKGCGKPKGVCLMFGSHADYYVENKLGRYISQEEALAVLDACEKAGLVNQPANMINPGGMCNCCGDCCALLRTLNKMPKPALVVLSNYYAAIDPDLCMACELCLTRCQMAAISINDDQVAVINKDRCIGCGLCVTECPTQAIVLTLKSQEQQNIPPANAFELMEQTSKIRGTTLIPLSTRLDK